MPSVSSPPRRALPVLILALTVFLSPAATPFPLGAQAAASAQPAEPGTQRWESTHTVEVDGRTIEYTATVGSIVLRGEKDEPRAEIFYTAYRRTGVKDASRRPILFAYNGGPGSSSFWLHMGVMGPRRVSTPTTEHADPPPYEIRSNPYTLLDRTDIVMVDPVGTGFSRPLGDTPGKEFWGVSEDARSLTQFIQRFLSRYHRWNSPKYLLGESYGTMRSAVLAGTLQRANIDLNGIVLVSAVLDLQTLIFSPGDDLPYVVNLPSYAATAWYHDALPGTRPPALEPFLEEVEGFALGEYASALLAGGRLDGERRSRVLEKLHAYTGLSREFLDQADLRVTAPEFEKELLREQGRVAGRLDARFTGPTGDLLERTPAQDPQSSAISGAYAAAWNTYLREELGYDGEREYVPSGNVRPWNWEFGQNVGFGQTGLTNVAPAFRRALERNPKLKVLLVNGLYDLATPYFAAVWTMDHMGLTPELRANIRRVDFEAGHMMYVHEPSLPRWREALTAFIDETSGVGPG
ncbi:MAG: S10 family peptidase [Gemmatimonadota bacterium]